MRSMSRTHWATCGWRIAILASAAVTLTACGDSGTPSQQASQNLGGAGSSVLGGAASGSTVTSGSGGGSGSGLGLGGQPLGGNPSTSVDCSSISQGDVELSVPSGTFQGSLSVSLTAKDATATIHYTTDGTPPSASSPAYGGIPIVFDKTTRLRAQGFVGGVSVGTPSTALYISSAIQAVHDLPVLVLDSYGSGKLPTEATQREFVDVGVLGFYADLGNVTLADRPRLASLGAFHVRGNSSAMFDKVPYRLELRGEAGADRDCEMFGMPSESDWALVGPHADKTLVHNAFVYGLGRAMGLQVPRLRLVEVYVNVDGQALTDDDYQGVYQLVETIKNQKNRLDLKQLDETKTQASQVSGGYIFKFEWLAASAPLITCPSGTANGWKDMELVDPNPIAQAQQTYLTDHLVAFNAALRAPDAANATTGYPSYIDVASFVDQVIVHELSRNMDAYARSQYFYKDRDAKIFAGPLWDFDLIAGVGLNPGGFGGEMANTGTEGFQYVGNQSRLASATSDWFPLLIAEPSFRAQLVARWKSLRQSLLADSALIARVDEVSAGLSHAAERNFKRWPILTQAQVAPFDTPTEATWGAQIAFMKSWLTKRAAWLDSQWK